MQQLMSLDEVSNIFFFGVLEFFISVFFCLFVLFEELTPENAFKLFESTVISYVNEKLFFDVCAYWVF